MKKKLSPWAQLRADKEAIYKALRLAAEDAYKSEVVDTGMVRLTESTKGEWVADQVMDWLARSRKRKAI